MDIRTGYEGIRMTALENALAEGNMISNIALEHLQQRPAGLMWIAPSIRSLERMELKMIENILSLKDVMETIDVDFSHLLPLNLVVRSIHLGITELLSEKRKILTLMEECMVAMEGREIPNNAASPGTISGRSSKGKEENAETVTVTVTEDRKFIERSLAELRSEVKKQSELPVLIPVPPSEDHESEPSFIPFHTASPRTEDDGRNEAICGIIQDGPESGLGGDVKKDVHRLASSTGKDGKIGGEVITGDEHPADSNIEFREQSRMRSGIPGIMGAVGALGMLAAASRGMSYSGKEEMPSEVGLQEPVSPVMEFEGTGRIDPASRKGMENAFFSIPVAVSMLSLAAMDSLDQSAVGPVRMELPGGMDEISGRSAPRCTIEDDVRAYKKSTNMSADPGRKMGMSGDEEEIGKRLPYPLKDESDEEDHLEDIEEKKEFPLEMERTLPLTLAELKFPIPIPAVPIPAMLRSSLPAPSTLEERVPNMKQTEAKHELFDGAGRSHRIGAKMERKTETDIPKRTLAETNLHHVSSAVSELSNIASDVIPMVTVDMGSHVPTPLFHPPDIPGKKITFDPRGKGGAADEVEDRFISAPSSPGSSFLGSVPDGYSGRMKKGIPTEEHLAERASGVISWTPMGDTDASAGDPYQLKRSPGALGPDRTRSPVPSYEPYASRVPVEDNEVPAGTLDETEEAQREIRYQVPSPDPSTDSHVSSITPDRGSVLDRALPEAVAPENRVDGYSLPESSLTYRGGREPDIGSGTYDAARETGDTFQFSSFEPFLSSYTPVPVISARRLGHAVTPLGMLSNIVTGPDNLPETPLRLSQPGVSKVGVSKVGVSNTGITHRSEGFTVVPTADEGAMIPGPVTEKDVTTLPLFQAMTEATEIDEGILPKVPDVGTVTIPRFPSFIETSKITLNIAPGLISGLPDMPVPFYWTQDVPGVMEDKYIRTLPSVMETGTIQEAARAVVLPREDIGTHVTHSFPGSNKGAAGSTVRHVPDVGPGAISRLIPITPGTGAGMHSLSHVPDPRGTEKTSFDNALSESLERLRALKEGDLLESNANETKKEKNDELYGIGDNERNIPDDMNRRDMFHLVEKMLKKEAKRYGLVFR